MSEVLDTPTTETVPDAATQMPDTGYSITFGQAIPTAVDFVNTIAFKYSVTQEKAIEWLAHRADTFKTLAESQA